MSVTVTVGSATDYLRPAVLGHTLAFQAYTMPAAIYVGLTTTVPTAATRGVEVAGGGYVRRQGTFALLPSRTDQASNAVTIEWPPATAFWGTVGWFELWDALSGGNRLYWGVLVDPNDMTTPIQKTINVSDIFRLPANNIIVQAF